MFFSFLANEGVCNLLESCELDETWTEWLSGERACYGGDGQTGACINYFNFIHLTLVTTHMMDQVDNLKG